MSGNLSKEKSKPRSCTPHPRKFLYTELVKSMAFHQGVWPKGIVCTNEVLNLEESKLQDQGLHHMGQPLEVSKVDIYNKLSTKCRRNFIMIECCICFFFFFLISDLSIVSTMILLKNWMKFKVRSMNEVVDETLYGERVS